MKVLQNLAEANGEVVLKSDLIEKIWDNYGGADDALMQTISKLRKYLSHDPHIHITNVHGKGYILEEN